MVDDGRPDRTRLVKEKPRPEMVEMQRDLRDLNTLNETIKAWQTATLPDDATDAQAAEFEELRKRNLDNYGAMLIEFGRKQKDASVEFHSTGAKAPPSKKSMADEVRDALQAARGMFGGGR